jgi:hypothetical protein
MQWWRTWWWCRFEIRHTVKKKYAFYIKNPLKNMRFFSELKILISQNY